MQLKDILGNLAGTMVILALAAAAILGIVMALAMLPMLVVAAPMTIAAVGLVILFAWLRRRS